MRIALVSEYYYPDLGGMPEHVHHLGGALERLGHQVVVVTTAFPEAPALQPLSSPPFEIVRLGRASGALIANGSVSRAAVGLRLHAQMKALFAQRRFDVIHVHAPIFPTLALLAIRCAPAEARLVGTLHTQFDDSRLLRFFNRPLQRYLDALDGLIAVSQNAITSMRRVGFRCDATIIPNGVALDYWRSGQRLAAVSKLEGGCNLLVQARLEPRNHISTVIAALRLLPEGLRHRVRLCVLGEGPEREQLLQKSAGLQVVLYGPQLAQRRDFAASSDIYCYTAALASHPMSLLEGMAAGLPVLGHDIEGVHSLVRDGVEGYILPLRDPAAYAQALVRLIDDPILRTKMGQAAQRRATDFDWPRVAGAVADFYKNCRSSAMRPPERKTESASF